MTAHIAIERGVEVAPPAAEGWRAHLIALALAAAAILLIFLDDAGDVAGLWWNISTFNHCLLIPPVIAWLVHQRAPELRRLTPRAWAPGLLVVAAGAGGWLLGEAGGVALARHAGLILMLQGAVIACLGKAVSRGLTFPIFYALFLIPVGQELVPPLQTVTAKMSMALLDVAGIPAHIEGIFITTPAGYFEVAEACSGVEFLVAMVAYGALVANLCFRSPIRRAAFMAAAAAIPVVANGLRAWGTIYISSFVGIEFAASFDHVVYGWFFFALIMALLMAVGWRFFDRKPADSWFDPEALEEPNAPRGNPRKLVYVAAAAVTVAAAAPLWSLAVAAGGEVLPSAEFALPEVPGWTQAPAERGLRWQPHYVGADLLRQARYRDGAGREVDLAVAVFARQEEGRELVGFGQGPAGPESGWAWTASAAPPPGGRADRIASHGTVREIATFYRIGSILTGSETRVKLETMKARLLGGPQRAVAVLVAAEAPSGGGTGRPAVDAFLAALGPVEPLADRAGGAQN